MEMRWTFGRLVALVAVMLVAVVCAAVGVGTALLRPRHGSD